MKKIILMRHGDYEDSGELSQRGEEKVKRQADLLKKLVGNGTSVVVIASPKPRAVQTARIIATAITEQSISIIKNNLILESYKTNAACDFIEIIGREADVVIIVSHEPIIEEIGPRMERRLGLPSSDPWLYSLVTAGFVCIDIETKTVS